MCHKTKKLYNKLKKLRWWTRVDLEIGIKQLPFVKRAVVDHNCVLIETEEETRVFYIVEYYDDKKRIDLFKITDGAI